MDEWDVTLSIDARAARWGERTAIVDVAEADRFAPAGTIDEDRLTYAGLARLSRWIAAALHQEGVETGETVALVSRNRVVTVAMVFACRRLGATFAPVSHRLTPVTVENPLSIAEPTLVVAESAQRDLVRGIDVDRTLTLTALFDAVEDAECEDPMSGEGAARTGDDAWPDRGDPDVDTASDDAALLAFHGSDGTPVATYSATAVEAACLSTLLTWGLGHADRTVLLRPLSRPDGLLGVALPVLYAGGRLAIDRAFDPADAATAVRRIGATFLAGEATEFRELLAADGGPEALETVEWLTISGSVEADLLEAVSSHGRTVRRSFDCLVCPNALAGGTDGISTDDALTAHDDGRGPIEPRLVGRPFLDVEARLVADGTVVSGAGTGKLAVAGPTVATDVLTDGAASGTADDDGSPERQVAWRRTGRRFRRDERGRYYLLDDDPTDGSADT